MSHSSVKHFKNINISRILWLYWCCNLLFTIWYTNDHETIVSGTGLYTKVRISGEFIKLDMNKKCLTLLFSSSYCHIRNQYNVTLCSLSFSCGYYINHVIIPTQILLILMLRCKQLLCQFLCVCVCVLVGVPVCMSHWFLKNDSELTFKLRA